MTGTKKHYQGQKKADGEYYNKRPLCNKCNEILKTLYIREAVSGTKKYRFVPAGYVCPICGDMSGLEPGKMDED
jgi:uncharacterized protein with PIN domain